MPIQLVRTSAFWKQLLSIIVTKWQFCYAGKPAIGDLDGDGYTDFIAPGYSADKLYVFTYAPLV